MPGPPLMQGLHTNVDDCLSLRLPSSVGEVHLLLHQTGECWTLMVTPLQTRLQAIGTDTGATEGIGRRSGWLQQDWTCRSLSQLIQVQK